MTGVGEDVAEPSPVSDEPADGAGARTARPFRPLGRHAVVGARHVARLGARRPRIVAETRHHNALNDTTSITIISSSSCVTTVDEFIYTCIDRY